MSLSAHSLLKTSFNHFLEPQELLKILEMNVISDKLIMIIVAVPDTTNILREHWMEQLD